MDYGGKLFSIANWMPTDKKAKKIIDAQIDSKELKSKGLRKSKKRKKKARKRA